MADGIRFTGFLTHAVMQVTKNSSRGCRYFQGGRQIEPRDGERNVTSGDEARQFHHGKVIHALAGQSFCGVIVHAVQRVRGTMNDSAILGSDHGLAVVIRRYDLAVAKNQGAALTRAIVVRDFENHERGGTIEGVAGHGWVLPSRRSSLEVSSSGVASAENGTPWSLSRTSAEERPSGVAA